MCLVDQLPCGSVLTPAISCTKFKIYLAPADIPMAKTFFFPLSLFREDQSLLHRSTNSERECVWWTNSLVGRYLHQLKISCTKFKIHLAHTDSPMAATFFPPLLFREDQSLLHRPRNLGRECAWWTNSLVGQYLHQLSLVQSSRSIQHMQTIKKISNFRNKVTIVKGKKQTYTGGTKLFVSQLKKCMYCTAYHFS